MKSTTALGIAKTVLEAVVDDRGDFGQTLMRLSVDPGESLGFEVEFIENAGGALCVLASRAALAQKALDELMKWPR